MKPRPRVIRGLVVLSVGLLLAGLGAALYLSQRAQRRELREHFAAPVAPAARFVSYAISYDERANTRVAKLARRYRHGRWDGLAELGQAAALERNDGSVLRERPARAAATLAGDRWHLERASRGQPAASNVLPDSRPLSIALAIPLPSHRILAVAVPLSRLQATLGSYLAGLTDTSSARLIDRSGRIVASGEPGDRPGARADPALYAALRSGASSFRRGPSARLLAVAAIAGTPWKIELDAPAREVLGPAGGRARWLPWLVFGALCAAYLAIALLLMRLERLHSRLELASSGKTRFLAAVAHELASPLNAIAEFARLLRAGALGELEEPQKQALAEIAASARDGFVLVDGLLDVTKAESGQIRSEPELVCVRQAIESACQALEPLALQKQIDVRLELSARLPEEAWLDPLGLRRVIANYLSNAIKYSPEGARVHVSAEPAGAYALGIHVEDEGDGIAAEHAAELFHEYARLGGDVCGGTGLGLALTKRIVESQGGRVGMAARQQRGSHFYAVIPYSAPVTRADRGPAEGILREAG